MSKQAYGPGYFESTFVISSHYSVFWTAGNGGGCSPAGDPTINGTGGTEDDMYESWGGAGYHNAIHYGGYGACHTMISQEGLSSGAVGTFHTISMYWSPTGGKIFCLDGVETWAVPDATSSSPAPVLFSTDASGWGLDGVQFTIQDFRYYTAAP